MFYKIYYYFSQFLARLVFEMRKVPFYFYKIGYCDFGDEVHRRTKSFHQIVLL